PASGQLTAPRPHHGGRAALSPVPQTPWQLQLPWDHSPGPPGDSYTKPRFSRFVGLPPPILTKAPSAELKPGQTDQDSLPPYDILDGILARMIDRHQSDQEIAAAGYDLGLVQQIRRMVQRAEFKRQQAAPGLKITDRAFGSGWRMPIAAQW
ncbi:MAG: NAD+ synthase, partial [Thermosynechococcus sp. Uc]|nr:NAD+ synthase [Thermosynechococcus sp. Uc]